jgi:hypothetical protein
MLYTGRRPGIKDGVGFQPGDKYNTKTIAQGKKVSNFVKGKARIKNDDSAYIIYHKSHHARAKNAHVHHSAANHAYI